MTESISIKSWRASRPEWAACPVPALSLLTSGHAQIQKRVESLRHRWKDERVVSLRDKLSFFMGVELVLASALLIGFRPQWMCVARSEVACQPLLTDRLRRPGVYTALSAYLLPLRIYEYRKKHFSYFLFDLCCQ